MPRPRTAPIRNPQLAEHIQRTGLTYESLALAVNRVGFESGTVLRCSASSLAKWLNGTTPQPATVAAAVEAFARLLDQPALTAAAVGWPDGVTMKPEDPWHGDPVVWITRMGRDDMLDRRTAVTAGVYSLAAASLPTTAFLTQTRPGPSRRAGDSDIARIRQMGHVFNELDDLHGGGHTRSIAASYLAQEVAPLLRGTVGRARPQLFTAAAEISYLVGWMSADDGHAGLAQRYYIQAVRLGDEARNPLMRATALRSLAVQALELGHAREGLALAQAADDSLPDDAPLRTRAWVTGVSAEATATGGYDPRRARTLLRHAERDLERAESRPRGEWIGNYQRPSYEHQLGLTLDQLGDLPAAEKHLTTSLATRAPGERRARALVGVRLVDVQIRLHRPDDAARTLLTLADDLTAVSSARVRDTLKGIRRRWQGYRTDPSVDTADHLLAAILRPSTTT
jgi:hypothetical protein